MKSLLAQSYQNFQIIIVDDCSTDLSTARAKHILADRDNVLILQNQSHIGLIKSRYAGISQAEGEYTTFVDADDWLESKALEVMVRTMQRFDVDLVQIRNQRRMKWFAIKYLERFDTSMCERRIEGDEFRTLASYVGLDSFIYSACWGKLYLTRKLRDASQLDFEQFWGEDQIFNIQYLRECKSMAFCDYVGYNYRWGGQTSSHKYSALKEYKYVHQVKRMLAQNEECLNSEIQMLLRYHIRSLITELGYTRDAVIMILEDELRDPLWKRVGMIMTSEELVDAEYADIQRNPMKYIAKRLLK
ncbi:MAG: glycosyltransferase family 2 protein [Prevotella sp.]|nr:glycosyltransferase family 2 protein [Prevotella sp.]MCM1075523.1 glycosyltransferase family 2 protein [Ruminococcus sp.]